MLEDQHGRPLPGVAPVAQQQAGHAARNIVRAVEGQPLRPFRYFSWGNLATIGRAAAIAEFGRVHLWGVIGWLVWLFVHIMKLVGFRNRVIVLVQWAAAYLTYQRSVRLITGRDVGYASPPATDKPPAPPVTAETQRGMAEVNR